MTQTPITEQWLREAGFRFVDDRNDRHWLLWLGDAIQDGTDTIQSHDDLGIEVATQTFESDGLWNCWMRADYSGRYSRFVHIRHIRTVEELAMIISAMVGTPFKPANVYYGSLRTAEDAQRLRRQDAEDQHRILARSWGKRVEQSERLDPDKREVLRP